MKRKDSASNAHTLIATLGSEPQVVTIVLDQLLARGGIADGTRFAQLIVIYGTALR